MKKKLLQICLFMIVTSSIMAQNRSYDPARVTPKPYQIAGMTFDPDKDSIYITRRIMWEESRDNGRMNVWMYRDEVTSVPKDSNYLYISGGIELRSLKQVYNEEKPQMQLGTKKHIRDGYFYDNKGLYHYYDDRWRMLENSNGKPITPILKQTYMVYDTAVYSFGTIQKLPLNYKTLNEMQVTEYDQRYLLTDGNYILDCQKGYGYSANERFLRFEDYFGQFFDKQPDQWQQIASNTSLAWQTKDNKTVLYFPNKTRASSKYYTLVSSPTGFYAFQQAYWEGVQKIDSVYIYNYDAKMYEPLQPDQFRYIGKQYYAYKNRVYMYGCPIDLDLNAQKLDFVTRQGQKTNFLFDGKYLIHLNDRGYKYRQDENKVSLLNLENSMVELTSQHPSIQDMSDACTANLSVLKDDKYLYLGTDDGLQVIPIADLGMPVKLDLY